MMFVATIVSAVVLHAMIAAVKTTAVLEVRLQEAVVTA
jgi:hypothetical protein